MTEEEFYNKKQLEKEYESAMELVRGKTKKVITLSLSEKAKKTSSNRDIQCDFGVWERCRQGNQEAGHGDFIRVR